jgi:hypothetical protein
MREMTTTKADWIRRRFSLSFEEVTNGMNKLAGTNYERNDAYESTLPSPYTLPTDCSERFPAQPEEIERRRHTMFRESINHK